jgi:MFS family permease
LTGQRLTVAAACLGWFFSAVDIVLLILFQTQVAAALGVEVQQIRIAIGVGLMGSAVGGIVFAQFGDRFGRVRTLGWSVILYSIATAGMALSPTVGVLMAFRFLAGVGTGCEWSVGFALIAEVWPSAKRGTLGGIVSAMFNLGTFLAIALFQSGLGWRVAFGLMFLPALGVVWLRMRVPESPVWLAMQKARAAGTVSADVEASMRRSPVFALLRGNLLGITLKATLIFAAINFAFYSFSTMFINYLQFEVAQGGLALDARAQAPYQIMLNSGALVGLLIAGALSDRLGRRMSYSLFCIVGVIGYGLLYAMTSKGAQAGTALILVFTIICMSYGIIAIMGSMSSELFPTHLRSTGPGFCQNLGKGIGGLIGPPLMGALLPSIGFAGVLSLPGICLAVLALLIWTLPDVSGRAVQPVESDAFLKS